MRCAATTLAKKKCANRALEGKEFCRVHQKLVDCIDVNQSEATDLIFSSSAGDIGLNDDMWKLVVESFGLIETRPLALTSKYFYRVFTSDKWFSTHPRYLLVHSHLNQPVASKIQTDLSSRFSCLKSPENWLGYRIAIDGKIQPEGTDVDDDKYIIRPLLTVVNTYLDARSLYRSLRPRGKIKAVTIELDMCASEVLEAIWLRSIAKLATHIYRTFNLNFSDQMTEEKRDRICQLIVSAAEAERKTYEFSYLIKENTAIFDLKLRDDPETQEAHLFAMNDAMVPNWSLKDDLLLNCQITCR